MLQQLIRQLVIHIRIKITITKHFDIIGNVIEPHQARKGYIKIQGFLRCGALFFGTYRIERRHIVQAVSQFNNQDARVSKGSGQDFMKGGGFVFLLVMG